MGNYDRKSSPCTGCMRAVKWIPVIFIVAILVWSYYAYIVQFSILTIDSVLQKIIYLIAYHVLFGLFLWSYWKTIFAPIGTVPPQWRISDADVERLFRAENQEEQKRILEIIAKDLPVSNRTANGSIRFCDKCHIIKPDRAHHCSVCGQCVLKMDHHCPWVNNCVNFSNYKYFVLFLGYALVYCLYVALTSLEYFIKFWRVSTGQINVGMGRFHILFLFCISLMFAVSLISLFSYHVYLVLVNRTTLESFRAPIFRIGGPDKNGYNLGKCANFQEVFGDNWKLWFFPVFTSSGDGLVYRTNSRHQSASYNSMGATQTRLEQPHDKFLEQTIDNLPLDHLTGNANDNLILNPNNIANGNVIIDKNNSNTETHCFIVNEVNDANVRNSNELASTTASNGKTTIRSGVTITGESTHPQPDSLLII